MGGELSRKAIEALDSPLARRVELYETIGSTQERALELAHGGAPHGTAVISRVQTGGRGRLGRSWGSPAGGLWMSLVLRPNLPAGFAPRVTQTAAVALAKSLWQVGAEARIKWPNDLLASGRKICGILAEASVRNSPASARRGGPGEPSLDFVVLGIGLNANMDPEELDAPGATTLRAELGRDVGLAELLGIILSSLRYELGRIDNFGAILDDWRTLNCTLGRRVRVRRSGEILEGLALDLNPEGALLLRTGGATVELFEGEIEQLRSRTG